MIRTGSKGNMVFFIIKTMCVILLLFGLFGLVWLKSNVVILEYKISVLEKKKADYLKDRKILLAQKAGLQSFETLQSSLRESQGFIFPDRVMVIHVKREKGSLTYKTSLEKGQTARP
jgi:hypothetical protein